MKHCTKSMGISKIFPKNTKYIIHVGQANIIQIKKCVCISRLYSLELIAALSEVNVTEKILTFYFALNRSNASDAYLIICTIA